MPTIARSPGKHPGINTRKPRPLQRTRTLSPPLHPRGNGSQYITQAKMKAEFGIIIPDMPEPEDFDINAYFDAIDTAIDKAPRWKIEPNQVELGFFSFGKFMIYNDLDSNKWPADKKPALHPIVINLFERGFGHEGIGIPEDAHIDEDTNAHQLFQVVDADSSQLLAMLAVNEGRNLVIQGPPGTGKSQTITNIIANAIGQGKKVLFVAEKMAALEVVKRRLDNINLGEACLELHSTKPTKKNYTRNCAACSIWAGLHFSNCSNMYPCWKVIRKNSMLIAMPSIRP